MAHAGVNPSSCSYTIALHSLCQYCTNEALARALHYNLMQVRAAIPLDLADKCSKHVSVQLRHMTLLSMILPCTTGNAAVPRTAVMHMLPITQIASPPNLPRRHQLHVFSPVSKSCHCGSSSKRSPVCQGSLHTAAASSSIRSQQPAKLAVFVSGGGSNFRAIHDVILSGHIHAQIAVRLKTSCLAFCVMTATDIHAYSDRLL